MAIKPHAKYVSVDGDADRIIYSFIDENHKFYLLDGDRIATLGIVINIFYSTKFCLLFANLIIFL